MISKKDVVRILVPYPNMEGGLAKSTHMYIGLKDGQDKELIKCQSFKPLHIRRGTRPLSRIVEEPNFQRNPFRKKTIIDCDKSFVVSSITIDRSLLADRDICDDIMESIIDKISVANFSKIELDPSEVALLNERVFTLT